MDNASAESFRRDARVIGVIGFAHAASHFLQLALPPLFPLLRGEFAVSWTLLGLVAATFYVASGLVQFCAGFVVDRVGARPVLLGGMSLLVFGTFAAALAPGAWWLFPCAAIMGAGNGVFHPSDFAVLNANVSPRRLGHAYSLHGIGGNLGYALAPIASFGLASVFGWREALLILGAAGLVVLGMLATQRAFLVSERHPEAQHHTLRGSFALFRQAAILSCFAFFIVQTMATVGMQTFAASALNVGFEVPLALANSAVTAYLLGASVGILAGGFLASHTSRHDRVAALGLAAAAVLTAVVAFGLPQAVLLPFFAVIGFAMGSTGPSRDLIVKSATPQGAAGRVYGFVYSGLDVGATLGPLWFGVMLDHGLGRQMYIGIAALLGVAIVTVLRTRRAIVANG